MPQKKVTTIISLGGSLIAPSHSIDVAFLKRFKRLILNYIRSHRHRRVVIICGGGKINSHYNTSVRRLNYASDTDLDWLGIMVTRVNAELVRIMFGRSAYQRVMYDPKEKFKSTKRIIIGAGYEPGCSTDYDAVLMARQFGARTVINMTNIDYAYDRDPRAYPDARKLIDISWSEWRRIVGSAWSPRLNAPFDPIASKAAERANMRVIIVDGKNLGNLQHILYERPYKGTTIQ